MKYCLCQCKSSNLIPGKKHGVFFYVNKNGNKVYCGKKYGVKTKRCHKICKTKSINKEKNNLTKNKQKSNLGTPKYSPLESPKIKRSFLREAVYWKQQKPSSFKNLQVIKPNKKIKTPVGSNPGSLFQIDNIQNIAQDTIHTFKNNKSYYYLKMHGGDTCQYKPLETVPDGYIYIFIGMPEDVTYPGILDESGWLSTRNSTDAEKKINLMCTTVLKPQTLFGIAQKTDPNKKFYIQFHTYLPGTQIDNIRLTPDKGNYRDIIRYEKEGVKNISLEMIEAYYKRATSYIFDNIYRFPWNYQVFREYMKLRYKMLEIKRKKKIADKINSQEEKLKYFKYSKLMKMMKGLTKDKDKFSQKSVIKDYPSKLWWLSDLPKHCPPGVYIIASCRGGAQNKRDIVAESLKRKVISTPEFQSYLKNLFKNEKIDHTHPLMDPKNLLTINKQYNRCQNKKLKDLTENDRFMCFGK